MHDDQLTILIGSNRVTEARGDASETLADAEPQTVITRVCSGCNREFVPARRWQKFCSRRCRTRGWRERKEYSIPNYYGA